MGKFVWLVVLLSLVTAFCRGQQGGGGFGAGGGFGQGNIGGAEEASYPPQNIEGGEEGQRWPPARIRPLRSDERADARADALGWEVIADSCACCGTIVCRLWSR